MINTILIGLGSNIGDKEGYLNNALEHLSQHDSVEVVAVSGFSETKAESQVDQPHYINAAATIKTILNIREFFDLTCSIEQKLGRDSKGNKDPRTIDIDILFFNDSIISEDDLIVPHPLLHEREFVLVPLSEIAPQWVHPIFQTQVSDLLTDIYATV
ncbi:2-amino-4-hydroxy-6-hydroxymethyldihydropteridine diphosphokinase [Candidatus Marinamargulisbacteria bacterium SCGC AG-414-C22]|nr:2-amino-4-hydroxy-6-hydroxymethyldihydropteridine diphosphokinase [Candidatus Marinamargulisbacteria bacterium SCGC AG-414-C22]